MSEANGTVPGMAETEKLKTQAETGGERSIQPAIDSPPRVSRSAGGPRRPNAARALCEES